MLEERKTQFKASFLKAIKKIEDNQLKIDIENTILNVEVAQNIKQIVNLKKLIGYNHYYRIRVGNYRIGIKIEDDEVAKDIVQDTFVKL